MKLLGAAFAVVLLFSNALRAEEFTEVRSVGGDIFAVGSHELKNAYDAMMKKGRPLSNSEKVFVNDDGSITIIRPRFTYSGVSYRISTDADENQKTNACRLFGFRHGVMEETEVLFDGKFVTLQECGLLHSVGQVDYERRVTTLASLTCR